MRIRITYVCGECGLELYSGRDMLEHEAGHLGLSASEHLKYKGLQEIAERRCRAVFYSNNETTRKEEEKAITELLAFEAKHNIKTLGWCD